MALLSNCSAEMFELQRLRDCLPISLQSRVSIVRSSEIHPRLITTQRTQNHRFSIQIDGIQWQTLKVDQRNLLFWHEVARIQSKTIPKVRWELMIMLIGLTVALIEVSSQNVISLTAALVAIALSAHQLYQRNRGERSLREAVAADRRAIHLATESGYSFSEALTSLYSALASAQQSNGQNYQVRLRALEILATEREKQSHRYPKPVNVSWQV